MEWQSEARVLRPTEMAWWREGRQCWYALYTRPLWEKRIASVLTGLEIETYLPSHQVWSRRTSTPKQVEEPIFPGYLFVRCGLTKQTWLNIKKTSGVVRILGVEAEPVPIPDWEIESLRKVLAVNPNVPGHPRLRKGDRVVVVKGPMRGVIGTLVEVSRNRHRLIVAVDLINQAVSANVDVSMVERYEF